MKIDTDELRTALMRIITPNFIKRRQVRGLLAEYNMRVSLRNSAYPHATPTPAVVDELDYQNSASLDRTTDWLMDNIRMFDSPETYQKKIVEQKLHEERQAELLRNNQTAQEFWSTQFNWKELKWTKRLKPTRP